MAKRRLYFNHWGTRGLEFPEYAVYDPESVDFYTKLETICRAVERKTGLLVVNAQNQGTELENNSPVATHYQLTLGRAARDGGYNVEGSGWISIPMDRS